MRWAVANSCVTAGVWASVIWAWNDLTTGPSRANHGRFASITRPLGPQQARIDGRNRSVAGAEPSNRAGCVSAALFHPPIPLRHIALLVRKSPRKQSIDPHTYTTTTTAMATTDAAATDDYWRDNDFSAARAQDELDDDDSTAGPPATTARKCVCMYTYTYMRSRGRGKLRAQPVFIYIPLFIYMPRKQSSLSNSLLNGGLRITAAPSTHKSTRPTQPNPNRTDRRGGRRH